MSVSRMIDTTEGMLPIEVCAKRAGTSIVGDGVTDDSDALMDTLDYAADNGIRELHCAKQYYAPSAYNLGLVILRGPGALIGTYRKQVIPMSCRAWGPISNIVPSIHLPRFSKALNPTVVIYGDSTGTPYGANHISVAQMLGTMLERSLKRSNPSRTINWVNRSIGGTTILNYNSSGNSLISAGISLPTFFTNPAAPWSGYISNQSPDLVIMNFGANGGTTHGIVGIDNAVGFLLAMTKVPDILLVTNLPRGTQGDVGSQQVDLINSRDYAAGATRSYAEYHGYGLIDMHRFGCMARDGFDPCSQIITQSVTSGTYSLPATLPKTQGDYQLSFQIDNTGGSAFGSGQSLAITLSDNTVNAIRLSLSSSNYLVIGYGGGSTTLFLTATNPGIAMPSGLCTIELSVRGNFFSLYLENTLAVEGICMRHGGEFTPIVQYVVGSGATQITSVSYAPSNPALVQPIITDAEMFGSGSFLQGGNAINHPASPTYEAIHTLFDQINLTAAGKPTQSITAATAINPDASLVQITGPTSSTYAVTLAAPRPQDQGNTLAIEMKSTTSTNSVTLALTNVTGGTASSTCTWNAAAQKLILLACGTTWEVIKEDGVTLT